jgi:glycosyltransferase involved in cell wall biosynthesis
MPPEISIVIPTHQREKLLELALDSLLAQTISPDRFEVVVVDNYPVPYEPSEQLCRAEKYSGLNLMCRHLPILGSSEARNFGIRFVAAPLVGFIDDDEKLPPHWIELALEISRTCAPDIFGGPYLPYYLEPKPAWFKDQYLTLILEQDKGWTENKRCLFGGNMVFKQEWLWQLKGFTMEYGRSGVNREYGEETEIQMRAYQAGAKLYYDPDLFIYHYAHPDRLAAGWHLTSAWYHGKAKARMYPAGSGLRHSFAIFRKLFVNALKVLSRYLLIPFRDRTSAPYLQNYLVQTIAPLISVLAMSWYLFLFSIRKSR